MNKDDIDQHITEAHRLSWEERCVRARWGAVPYSEADWFWWGTVDRPEDIILAAKVPDAGVVPVMGLEQSPHSPSSAPAESAFGWAMDMGAVETNEDGEPDPEDEEAWKQAWCEDNVPWTFQFASREGDLGSVMERATEAPIFEVDRAPGTAREDVYRGDIVGVDNPTAAALAAAPSDIRTLLHIIGTQRATISRLREQLEEKK